MDRILVALTTSCALLALVVVAAALPGPWFVPIAGAIVALMLAVIAGVALRRRGRRLAGGGPIRRLRRPHAAPLTDELEARRGERRHGPIDDVAVVVVDIDHFSAMAGLHGEPAAEEASARVAALIDEHLRVGDLCHRGDIGRFTVLLPGATVDDAYEVAERLRLQAIVMDLSAGATVTVSVGVAAGSAEGLDDLVAVADAALARAKSTGRNRTVVA